MHPRLRAVVARHLHSRWRQPLHGPSVAAFERVAALLGADEVRSLVLDSGCGTGASSRRLAARHAPRVVLGVDRSRSRLGKAGVGAHPLRRGNLILARADVATFWRLAREAGWCLHSHYLLYPNPWPKPGHLRRRWHAHPVFPVLLELGGELILRTNWETYAREFALALRQATGREASVVAVDARQPWSPFERKYALSGHALYEVRASLPTRGSGTGTAGNCPR